MEHELGVTKAREEFSNIVEGVQYRGATYIISRHGKPAAAVVPIEIYEGWKRERREFFDLIRETQQDASLSPREADRLGRKAVSSARTKSKKRR